MKDLHNVLAPKRSTSPVSVADNTAQVGQWIDIQGYDALLFLIALGSIADADATFAVLVEDANASNQADAAAVDDAFLIGTEVLAGFQFDTDNGLRKIGYKGLKRYVRLTVTPTGNASAALLCVIALLGHPFTAPTANPPT